MEMYSLKCAKSYIMTKTEKDRGLWLKTDVILRNNQIQKKG